MANSTKPNSASTKSKLAKTLLKFIHIKTATKALSFNLLRPQEKPKYNPKNKISQHSNEYDDNHETELRNRVAMEAFLAKLFASVAAVKAAYAELQTAQNPYNVEAIQSSDEALVHELKALLELKQSFLKKQIDSSPPQVTLLLAEIQEQQSLMKMYEITMSKMRSEIEAKESEILSIQTELNEIDLNNKLLDSSSESFSVLDGMNPSESKLRDFITVLHYTVKSIRSFVRVMIGKMESVNWDIEIAASAIDPRVIFSKSNHICFAFESFVSSEMLEGFDRPSFSSSSLGDQRSYLFVDRFNTVKSANPIHFLKQNPNSSFGKFTRTKYLRLIHPKMEASFYGDLNQRELIESGEFPETGFFAEFAEMAKRIWLLHCLAFSFDGEVNVFGVGKGCRFSEVYMQSVNDDVFDDAADGGGFEVAMTVVPGFKIGKTVIQSQVYLSPVKS
ncbi:protein GRAVITROPIC IN THE LIGHT 1-like [Cornus florida]|uniref:protein GRAVITROPIC IN THE LIGHT 1-like n=1 Tax=Cornus florida TaxID=4283 RepID=UPI0028987BAC|nr:protein GRAVITROPIC IN THE LIGHT 1-like [Cornus florida]